MRSSRTGRPVLRDVATLCLEPFPIPGGPLCCELDKGHLDQGQQHKSGCTRWGRASVDPEEKPDA